jgi:transposase
MVAEIGDITRFASARKLASWAGLSPTVRHGHIPGQGSVWVRWILCEAAQKAKHSLFAASYQTIRGNPAKWSGLCR